LTLKKNTISIFKTIYLLYKYLPTWEQTLTNLKLSKTGNWFYFNQEHARPTLKNNPPNFSVMH